MRKKEETVTGEGKSRVEGREGRQLNERQEEVRKRREANVTATKIRGSPIW